MKRELPEKYHDTLIPKYRASTIARFLSLGPSV